MARRKLRQSVMRPDNKQVKKKITNAEKCKAYRERSMQNESYRKSEQLRKRIFRMNRTDEKIAHEKELARLRMAKKRQLDKQKTQAKSKTAAAMPITRQKKTEQQKKWREAQQNYRKNLSAQKKRRIRERDRTRKAISRESARNQHTRDRRNGPLDDQYTPYQTPGAERKAVSRARRSFPTSPTKFNSVLHGLIKSASRTPRKRNLMHESGVILTPNKKRRIEFLETTMTTFKAYYQQLKASRKSKDTKQRRVLSSHVARMKKYKRRCCAEMGIGCATLLHWSKLEENSNTTTKSKSPTYKAVQDFFLKPYISYTHAGKKAVLKRLNKQRQTMTRSLRSAYEIYLSENPNIKISYSKFTKLRPKHVQTQDRGKFLTCLCEKCVNIEMKLKAINSVCDNQLGNKYDVTRITLCDYPKGSLPNIECAKRQCSQCGTNMLKERLHRELSSTAQIVWLQWTNCKVEDEKSNTLKNRKVLERNEGEVRLLAEKLVDDMEDFSYHLFCATWQHKQYTQIKDQPQDGHVVAVLDFAENYTCNFQDECQSAHWCKTQVMIHPVVCNYKVNSNTAITHEIVFISDDLKHDAHVVHAISGQVLQILRSDSVVVKKIVQFTDGCASQYKSKIPFLDVSYAKKDFGVDFERNFFGSGHGKGPADGCSGVIKSAVTRAVKAGNTVVRNAEEFFRHCSQHLSKETESFKRSFHFLKKEDMVRDRPERLVATTVKGTRKIHSVKAVQPKIILTRDLSCACNCCQNAKGECMRSDVVKPWETKSVTNQAARRPARRPATDLELGSPGRPARRPATDLELGSPSAYRQLQLSETTPAVVQEEIIDPILDLFPQPWQLTDMEDVLLIDRTTGNYLKVRHGSDFYPAVVVDTPAQYDDPPENTFYAHYFHQSLSNQQHWTMDDTVHLIPVEEVVQSLTPPDILCYGRRYMYCFENF